MPYLLFCLLFCGTPDTSRLSQTLDSLLGGEFHGNIPGMAVLVARQGHIIYKKAFGSANIELGTPLSPDMVFKMGSISKQFTAVGILHLVEQGRIHLTDSIQKYLKDYPWKGKKITIENLLTHTSGIIDFMSLDDPDPYIERREFKPQQIIHYFENEPLQFDPGSKYAYSNSNYTLLGYIVQTVTGIPFHTYMRDSILMPAGLLHTGYPTEQTVLPGRVEGYTRDRGYYENADFQSISLAFGCGDLLSTPEDLYHWNNALLEGKILRKETLQKAWTPYRLADGQSTHYGYAWFVDSLTGYLCIHHEGQIYGFISEEKYFPTEDLYVCTITNLHSAEDKTIFSEHRYQLMQDIAEAALGKSRPPGVSLPDSLLDRYVGTYRSVENTKLTISIYKEEGRLFADLSNHTGRHMLMVPEDSTRFYLPDILRIRTTVDVIVKDGKVSGLTITQEKPYAFTRLP